MRKILIILVLFITSIVRAGTYYVSTTGNDSNAGTLAAPWLTWQKGWNTIVAGDTLYIRGGTYQPTAFLFGTVFSSSYYTAVGIDNHDGTAENRIVVMNYPGETPVLDGVNVNAANGATGVRYGIFMRGCSYWHIKGIEITGFVQLPGEISVGPFLLQQSSNYNIIEQVKSYSNGNSGISFKYDCTGNYIYNCDTYDNYDQYSTPTPGNNSDGIEIADITDTNMVNTVRGCRMWDNSDDGMDLMRNEGQVIIDSCWAFYNGVTADYQATGFKLGWAEDTVTTIYGRVITNCIAAYNMNAGFAANNSVQMMEVYNNIAIGNGYHGFFWYVFGDRGGASIFRNNIALDNVSYQYSWIYLDRYTFDHNNGSIYGDGPTATIDDFVSVNANEMYWPRKSNGCLPDINFLRLAPGSDMIDAGTDVGIAYDGSAPDLGPFEYTTYTAPTGTRLATGTGNDIMVDKNGNVMIIQ